MKIVFITNFILIINLVLAQNIDSIAYYYNTSQYYKAINFGINQIDDVNANSNLSYLLGKSYQNINKYLLSEKYLKTVYFSDKKNIQYINSYAQILAKNNNTLLAIELFQQALKIDSCNFTSLNNLSKLYYSKKKYNDAIEIYKQLIKQDTLNTYYYRKVGKCYSKLKNWELSYNFYNKAYKIDSTNLLNIQTLAYFLYKSKKYDNAIKICNKGILIDSLNSDFYKIKANSYYGKNHFYLAVPQYKKILKLKDSSYNVIRHLGIALYETQKYEEALPYNIAVYNADSSSYSNSLYLSKNYLALENYDSCIKYAERTIWNLKFANKISIIVIDNETIAYSKKKEYKKALELYEEKYKLLGKRYLFDYYNIAILYDKLDNNKDALKNFKKVIKTSKNKENPYYIYSKKRITQLLEDIHFEGN